MVSSPEEAAFVVREAKYPPIGRRGLGYCRANNHGLDFEHYARAANDEIALVVQIENKEAIASLDGILDVPP